jgi:hypothetical protein
MEYFSEVQDPGRETRNKKYPLIEVIVIAFLAVMSGANGWESIERCGIMREKWLCKFLALREGIPPARRIPAGAGSDTERTV